MTLKIETCLKWLLLSAAVLFCTETRALADTAAAGPQRCPTCGQLLQGRSSTNTPQPGATGASVAPPEVGAPEGLSPLSAAAPAASRLSPYLVAALAGPLAVTGGVLTWFLVVLPRRRRCLLLDALALLAQDDMASLPDVERLLTQALTAGLRKQDIAEARFALAYVRTRLERYAEAEAVLADLEASGPMDRETAYLDLWLKCRQKKYEEAGNAYRERAGLLGDFLQTRLIVSIAFLHLARLHWARKEVDGALHYFEEIRRLNVLTSEIPAHIDDHRLVFGVMAVFEKNLEEARRHFEGAREAASQAHKPTYPAEIGLLMCHWRATERPNIDDALTALLPTVEADCLAAGPKAASDGTAKPGPVSEMAALLRNCRLWHAVSLLLVWLQSPAKTSLRAKDLAELDRRLQRVKDLDEHMGDPWLIEGLIHYYFSADDAARQAAVEAIDKACHCDVNVPDVLFLLQREKRLQQLYREGLTLYIALAKEWLSNSTVSEVLREELQRHLAQFSRFKELGEVAIAASAEASEPSVADVQTRAQMMHDRIQRIVRPRLSAARHPEAGRMVESMMGSLTNASKALESDVKDVEKAEQGLMKFVGEHLLKEESEIPPDDDAADGLLAALPAESPSDQSEQE